MAVSAASEAIMSFLYFSLTVAAAFVIGLE
jgi:hypothetical protein